MSLRAFVLAVLAATPTFGELSTYTVDSTHSSVGFSIRHLVGDVEGRFREFSGIIKYDPQNIQASSVQFAVRASSISTDNEERDQHLKGAEFFEVDKFPTLSFQSKAVKPRGAGKMDVFGMLTIKGVSKAVQVPCTVPVGPGFKGEVIGVFADLVINREDYGIIWNSKLDRGGTALGDEVRIRIRVEGEKQR
ncbi:YceI family protein [bacterium]|nr:YceI family protein [bacterium]